MARKVHQDTAVAAATNENLSPRESGSEGAYQAALRPQSFDEYVGQKLQGILIHGLPLQEAHSASPISGQVLDSG